MMGRADRGYGTHIVCAVHRRDGVLKRWDDFLTQRSHKWACSENVMGLHHIPRSHTFDGDYAVILRPASRRRARRGLHTRDRRCDSAHAINQLPGTFFKAMHFAPLWTVVTLVTGVDNKHARGASKFEGWATSFLMRVAGTPAISG